MRTHCRLHAEHLPIHGFFLLLRSTSEYFACPPSFLLSFLQPILNKIPRILTRACARCPFSRENPTSQGVAQSRLMTSPCLCGECECRGLRITTPMHRLCPEPHILNSREHFSLSRAFLPPPLAPATRITFLVHSIEHTFRLPLLLFLRRSFMEG